MDGPLLWFLNRGTGFALLGLLTLSMLLGVLATRGNAGRGLPRFVTQGLHRNLSLISTVLLLVHIAAAVADEYVDIRWWQAVVPFGATYEPLWLSLGTVATEIIAVVVVTSLVRRRMNLRAWRGVHVLAYAAWAIAVAHGIGIGTDTGESWATAAYAISIGLVSGAVLLRCASLVHGRVRSRRATASRGLRLAVTVEAGR